MSTDTPVWKVTASSQASGSGHGQHTSVAVYSDLGYRKMFTPTREYA
jgi:hypothetical protein